MSIASETTSSQLESLSALIDGELGADDAAAACRCWREDDQARAAWHVYHLIGDVLRSDDLAVEPARNAAMLAAIRTRLAGEAVVLAPEPLLPSRVERHVDASGRSLAVHDARFPWVVSSAVAAGFVAVIGTFMVMRQPESSAPSATVLAAASQPRAFAASPRAAEVPTEANPARSTAVVSAGIVRDPRLDAYLAAHKQFAGSSALGVPSAFLRGATVETNGR